MIRTSGKGIHDIGIGSDVADARSPDYVEHDPKPVSLAGLRALQKRAGGASGPSNEYVQAAAVQGVTAPGIQLSPAPNPDRGRRGGPLDEGVVNENAKLKAENKLRQCLRWAAAQIRDAASRVSTLVNWQEHSSLELTFKEIADQFARVDASFACLGEPTKTVIVWNRQLLSREENPQEKLRDRLSEELRTLYDVVYGVWRAATKEAEDLAKKRKCTASELVLISFSAEHRFVELCTLLLDPILPFGGSEMTA
jgi:hypothetical protein